MLRSLGSSLLAKSSPGAATRDLLQSQMTKPAIPGKGEIGTVSRDLVTEPQITAAAPGSEKIVSSLPGIEGTQTGTGTTQTVPPNLLADGGMGLPSRPGMTGPMAFTDQVAPAAASAPVAGRTAVARSGAGQTGDVRATGSILPEAASVGPVSVQAERPNEVVGSFFPGVASLGNRAAAGGGDQVMPKNLAQAIVATLSPAGSKGEAWATNPQVTKSGAGSISGLLNTISNKVGSVGPGKTSAPIGQTVSNILRSISSAASSAKNTVSSKLRSLFRK